jgi:hypothetical protein
MIPRIKTTTETWFTTSDGARFSDNAKAEAHQALIADVEAAMAPLRPRPVDPSCNFANGGGYLQQDRDAVHTAKRALWRIFCGRPSLKFAWEGKQGIDPLTVHPSWVCRMLDGSHDPLGEAYSRLWCISDVTYREYGQLYYSTHEREAKQVAL